jgi:hypothetical protein
MSLIISARRNNKSAVSLNADGTYEVPNGTVIDCIKLVPSAGISALKIGTSAGGEEILPEQPLNGGETSLIGTLINGGTTIYFTGITASIAVTFFKK